MTVLTHRADGGFLVAIYLLQLQRGGGAAQVVDVGIVGKTDEAILIDDIQGSGDALLPGIYLFQYQLHATHIPLQITVGFLLHSLDEIGRSLEVDVSYAYLAIGHLVVIALHLRRLVILETQGQREGTETLQIHIIL